LRHLFAHISSEFEPVTLEAFKQVALEERPVAQVAAALGMSAGAVYVSKSRVLRRLREVASRLIGDELWGETDRAKENPRTV
jgi:DNA-directed RNA polymerase specialized sigma24 family protein